MFARAPFALASVIAVVIAGCGNSSPPSAAPPSAAPPSASPPTSASVPPSRTGTEVLTLGESAITQRESQLTFFAWKPSGRAPAPPSGEAWYEADVEFCMAPQIQSAVPVVTILPEFGVELASGTLVRPEESAASPNEAFAQEGRTIVARECVRGAVVFAVPTDDPARHAGYFRGPFEIRWAIPAG